MMCVEGASSGALCLVFMLFVVPHCLSQKLEANLSALLTIDASPQSNHMIPETLFGIFFEVSNFIWLNNLLLTLLTQYIRKSLLGHVQFLRFFTAVYAYSFLCCIYVTDNEQRGICYFKIMCNDVNSTHEFK